jgi:predicted RND superfamily exporter protein
MSLHDVSIRTRLLLLTGLGIAIMLLLIGLGIYTSGMMRNDIERLGQRDIPMTKSAAEIRRDVLRNWINTLYLTQVSDNAMQARILEDMKQNTEHVTVQFDVLQKAVESAEEKNLLEQAIKARGDYNEARQSFIDLQKQGNAEATSRFLMTQVRPKLDAFINTLNAQLAADVGNTVNHTEGNAKDSRTCT